MSFTKTLFIVSAFLPLIATLIPFSRNSHWTTRGFDFPRFQIFVCLVAVFFVHLLVFHENIFDTALLVLIVIAAGWQAYSIFPFTPLASKHVLDSDTPHPDNTISFVVSNVLQTNRNAEGLLEIIAKTDPDIILTLETDRWWEEQLSRLEQEYSYSCKCPQDNLYGMHVFSALPISDERIEFLVEQYVPSIHASFTLKNGVKLQAHFLHPAPPSPSENTYSSERDAELIVVAKKIAKSKQPILVSGDLNDVAWSYTTRLFRKISGLLDPRIGRGMFNTFHTKYWFARWPLDHMFHSEHFTLHKITRLACIGSDHFPLLTTLVYEPKSQDSHVDADKEDKKTADHLTQKESVTTHDVPKPSTQ